MNNDIVRVLHITEMLSAAGIESFIMNMYREIDRNKVQFDFLVLRDEHEFYEDEISKLGGVKYWIHSDKKNTLLRIYDEATRIKKFLKVHHYDIVHIHYTTPLRAPYLKACIDAGVKTRIYHSHSAWVSGKNPIKIAIYNYMKRKITKWATDYFACSLAAANWIFEKKLIETGKVKIIHNGIDTKLFSFNSKDREIIRRDFGLTNKFVLIHTGRFKEQKNHKFLIDVFAETKKKYSEAVLLLLGTGELIDDIREQVNNLNLKEDVVFLGVQPDVNKYLSAADCYIMPSLYEGLPVAAVEAQCSGLPCIFSINITKEVALIDSVVFVGLDEPIENWVNKILMFKGLVRNDQSKKISDKGYNMKKVVSTMQNFYLSK